MASGFGPSAVRANASACGTACLKAREMIRMMPGLCCAPNSQAPTRFHVEMIPGRHGGSAGMMQAESPSGPPGSVKPVQIAVAARR